MADEMVPNPTWSVYTTHGRYTISDHGLVDKLKDIIMGDEPKVSGHESIRFTTHHGETVWCRKKSIVSLTEYTHESLGRSHVFSTAWEEIMGRRDYQAEHADMQKELVDVQKELIGKVEEEMDKGDDWKGEK